MVVYCRVLDQVNFGERFEKLPQFNPETSDIRTPLPQSPRGIIAGFKKRKPIKVSSLGRLNVCVYCHQGVNVKGFLIQTRNMEVYQKKKTQYK